MKKKRLTKRKEFVKALIDYHKNYYTDGGFPSIFDLQKKMLEIGICPRCGSKSRRWCSNEGHFPCWDCGFWITPRDVEKIVYEEGSPIILRKRLKGKIKWS